ncbi:Uma2 family endonuclease [Actinosynnema sp. NPDC047251]|uniref:Uma2 family endonuclease n=1 Tax=Saccharothrix espanaensis TaxID=103731 RepID=UPI00130D4B4B|nr:Uma2 family endonuclease [Saccharothrix espanaensis]
MDLPPTADGSRIELILGYLTVTPAPTGDHQMAAFNLAILVREALRAAGMTDLHVAPAVNVRISTAFRAALIPDMVVLDRKPTGVSFPAEALKLAVEVWSPGNTLAEREFKMLGYAGAGVPHFWTVDLPGRLNDLRLTAYRLDNGTYVEENVLKPGEETTITAAPFPVTLDVAELAV